MKNPLSLNLTEKKVSTLELPEKGKRISYFDLKVPALYVRVSGTGSKSYYISKRVEGKLHHIRIGKVGEILLKTARELALRHLSDIERGIDLFQKKKNPSIKTETFEDYFNKYMAAKSLKPSTIKDYNRQLNENLSPIKNQPIDKIGRQLVLDTFEKASKRSKARGNGAMRVFRAVYNYAIGLTTDDYGVTTLPPNPTKALGDTKSWNPNKRKKTIIHPEDLPKWLDSVRKLKGDRTEYGATVSRFFLSLLITGWRTGQLANLKWSSVDLNSQMFKISDDDVKNKDGNDLPMSRQMALMLTELKSYPIAQTSEYVFAEPNTGKPLDSWRYWVDLVTKDCGVKWTPYDLRRSFLTYGAECLDLNMLTIKRLAQHKTQEADVTAGYIVPLADRLRRATQKISDYVLDSAATKSYKHN